MCVNHPYLGFENLVARRNLYQRDRVLRERVQHIQITAVYAEFAHACGDTHSGSRFEQFSVGDKRVPWISSALFFAHPYPPKIKSTALSRARIASDTSHAGRDIRRSNDGTEKPQCQPSAHRLANVELSHAPGEEKSCLRGSITCLRATLLTAHNAWWPKRYRCRFRSDSTFRILRPYLIFARPIPARLPSPVSGGTTPCPSGHPPRPSKASPLQY